MTNTSIYSTKQPVFYAVSAPAGTGKTTAAIEYAADKAGQGQLFLFAVPSLDKVNEVEQAIKSCRSKIEKKDRYDFSEPFNLEVITSKSHSGIEKALSSCMTRLHKEKLETGKGAVIIATHEGLLISNELAQQENKKFHLIWDETTSIIFHIEGNILKEMKTALFDGILNVQEENGVWKGEVAESNIARLKEKLKEKGIGIRDSIEVQTITKHLLNAGQGFNDILLGGNIENRISMIFVYNHLKFHGWKSVTFMGANLEMTNLHQWFSKKGIEWKQHEEIYSEVNHVPGEIHNFRLNIHYGTKDQNHSKYFLDKTNDENKPFRDLFREKAMELIGNTPTLLMKNCKDYKLMTKEEFLYPENFITCPWNMERAQRV